MWHCFQIGEARDDSFLNATGVLLCSVELLPGKMEKGISEFIAQQQQIFRYGFTETEIERAKKERQETIVSRISPL